MSGIAEVISAHWSRSTFTNHKPHVDKCDGCGAVIYTWGDDPIPGGIEPLADHQAAVLTAAGFGPVKEAKALALEEAADELARLPYVKPGADGRDEYGRILSIRRGETDKWLKARAAAALGIS